MDMNSPMRNAKSLKLGEQKFDEGRSRICNLPDPIIHHILSFLPTKEAAKTSALSKRWQFLWTFVTNLEFNEEVWQQHDVKEETRRNFMSFVERVLFLSDPSSIRKFLLSCKVLSDQSRISTWVHAALKRKVQRLILHFPLEDFESLSLPDCLFTCESLKELDLEFSCVLNLPSYICFPHLKILSLSNIKFPDDHSAQELFSSCPNLVKLTLDACDWENVKGVHISAPLLEVIDIFEEDCQINQSCCQFMISGTKLKLFCYQGVFENDFCVFDAPSLEEADMVQLGSDDIEDNLEMQIAAYRCYKLFKGLANVKRLQVTNGSLEFLASAEELVSRLPSLPNLKHLAVDEHEYAVDFACIGLLKILQNSPCLESIDFKRGVDLPTYDENNDWTLDPVPPCFLTHLKTVTIRLFSGSDKELHVLGECSDVQIAAHRAYKLLKGLTNVKSLVVTPDFLELLTSVEELVPHLPSFPNLKYLALDEYEYAADFASTGLMKLLQKSPYLESLDFKWGVSLSTYKENKDWTLDPVPSCFSTHLKTVTIRILSASKKELHVVKVLLRTAKSLEKLCFPSRLGDKKRKRLLTLLEESESACDIVFMKLRPFYFKPKEY
ncbi:hypothetical protein CCACVL1_15453 [Corchorus capsularis]|uniref:F-box domain-containing protein n=1 Tax=Corchorus capsularis TaxID=210143 RepID=A0A1R3I2D7_COCAP|nr:hypothetical protein CCACVL1_15453 [Corchorus capsularis]